MSDPESVAHCGLSVEQGFSTLYLRVDLTSIHVVLNKCCVLFRGAVFQHAMHVVPSSETTRAVC